MPRVTLSARALADVERLSGFLEQCDPRAASAAIETIFDALAVLQRHPLLGRSLEGAIRELVVSYGEAGYVALYRFQPRRDRVEVLAIRHQREAGYG
jgi:plasmid stabilization system protein ParE